MTSSEAIAAQEALRQEERERYLKSIKIEGVTPEQLATTLHGGNIYKGGSDPVIGPDSDYPDWVFELSKPRPSFQELYDRENAQPGSLDDDEVRRLIKLWSKRKLLDKKK